MSGYAHTCARKRTGELFCWGKNSQGQLGIGRTGDRATPVHVETLGADVATIGMGRNHGCAHKTDGTLWCWGKNSQGQLGDGTRERRAEPVQVVSLGEIVAEVSSGTNSDSTCAVDNGGYTWCWGKNSQGQLGDGTTRSRSTPTMIATDANGDAFNGVTDVCVGKQHACGRRSSGEVWCWGSDSHGQLGDDHRRRSQRRPVRVALSGDAQLYGLSCGSEHTCALLSDGSLECWGSNRDGQLGDGSFRSRRTPVAVTGLEAPVEKLTLASRHSCAIERDGQIWCWGRDSQDVLFPGRRSNVPVALDFARDE